MDEAELDQVRERIEWSMAQQRREYGDDECQWPWATVPDTTVQKRPSHIRKLQLQVAAPCHRRPNESGGGEAVDTGRDT